jgi:hypothetical protein
MNGMPSFANPANLEPSQESEIAVRPDASPLEFLQAVFRNPNEPMGRRLRAAIECLPFLHPKLSVTYAIDGQGLAAQLEKRLERLKVIEHQPEQSSNQSSGILAEREDKLAGSILCDKKVT